jgi:hypothetical protein
MMQAWSNLEIYAPPTSDDELFIPSFDQDSAYPFTLSSLFPMLLPAAPPALPLVPSKHKLARYATKSETAPPVAEVRVAFPSLGF